MIEVRTFITISEEGWHSKVSLFSRHFSNGGTPCMSPHSFTPYFMSEPQNISQLPPT